MARLILATAMLLATATPIRAQDSGEDPATEDSVDIQEAPAVDPRVECIIRVESRGDPNATNPRSGAAGLGQFLASTWRTTPQGRAGWSVYNAAANRAAVAWMLQVGRAREFVAVSGGWC